MTKDVDPERRLSDQGRADITRLVAWRVSSDVAVSRIWHSGKTRARQTAELVGAVLEGGGKSGCMRGMRRRVGAEGGQVFVAGGGVPRWAPAGDRGGRRRLGMV